MNRFCVVFTASVWGACCMIKLELMVFAFPDGAGAGQLMPLVQKSPSQLTPGKLGSSTQDGPEQWKFSEKPLPTPQSVNWPWTMDPILMTGLEIRECVGVCVPHRAAGYRFKSELGGSCATSVVPSFWER